jgi:2-oxoglutarate dehydrogenase E2 component (dihydrolipoamide succinyltransferase)
MPTNVDVPALGESVREAVLIKWHKADGEAVNANEPLAELETDKANVDMPAPSSGVLRRVKNEGDTVQVGETIARIDEGGTATAAAGAGGNAKAAQAPTAAKAPAPKPSAPPAGAAPATKAPATTAPTAPGGAGYGGTDTSRAAKPQSVEPPSVAAGAPAPASGAPAFRGEDFRPSVRRIAEEEQINPAAITGTGPRGQVTKEDAMRAVAERAAAPAAPAAPAPEHAKADAAGSGGELPTHGFDADGIKRVPMSKIRKKIAERLVQAQQTAAILTTFNEIDLQNVMDLRSKYKEKFEKAHGIGLGFMSFFARACVLALREFPRVNGQLDGDDIVYHDFVHLGIAVSTDRGLAVPVLRHVERMGFAKIESEIKRLATATRDNKLSIPELSGGTFTITNGGVFGSLLSTPIINPPQSAILGMHAIQKRPVVVGDQIVVRPMMYVALSYDHRLIDGKESVSFLVRVKEYLEDPARLMLEV